MKQFLSTAATKAAFDVFREQYGPAWGPRLIRNPSESDQLLADDGLSELTDGPEATVPDEIGGTDVAIDANTEAPEPVVPDQSRLPPFSQHNLPGPAQLWVVRGDDVLYAAEACPFGEARAVDGRIKHTNLTGGQPAFSGGELVFLDNGKIVVSGNSGRYGPRSATEMSDVAIAFRDAGYTVYSTGYDQEANRAQPLIGPAPKLI